MTGDPVGVGRTAAGAAASVALLYRWTDGRLPLFGADRLLLLTVTGSRTGIPRTTPFFYLRDGERIVICDARPRGERANPWVANLRRAGRARLRIGGTILERRAQVATEEEVARYWPRFVRMWPPYERHFAASGERTLFVLDPDGGDRGRVRPAQRPGSARSSSQKARAARS